MEALRMDGWMEAPTTTTLTTMDGYMDGSTKDGWMDGSTNNNNNNNTNNNGCMDGWRHRAKKHFLGRVVVVVYTIFR
jgi:hypothetical protein